MLIEGRKFRSDDCQKVSSHYGTDHFKLISVTIELQPEIRDLAGTRIPGSDLCPVWRCPSLCVCPSAIAKNPRVIKLRVHLQLLAEAQCCSKGQIRNCFKSLCADSSDEQIKFASGRSAEYGQPFTAKNLW